MTWSWIRLAALVAALVVAGCGAAGGGGPTGPTDSVSGSTGPTPSSGGVDPSNAPPPSPPRPRYSGRIGPITEELAARMASSWRPGCPVPLEDLRYLSVTHWDFDGEPHRGELVVHRDAAGDLVEVFRDLFRAGFPIERMRLVDEYGADDDASMAANNTSAFNCRLATGGDSWSEHAYGRAIDVNPVQNPYVTSSVVLPPAGDRSTDRSLDEPGMIHDDDAVVRAFAAIGWEWGGNWSSLKDYQHFSASGR